jgi:hypothetical protein
MTRSSILSKPANGEVVLLVPAVASQSRTMLFVARLGRWRRWFRQGIGSFLMALEKDKSYYPDGQSSKG